MHKYHSIRPVVFIILFIATCSASRPFQGSPVKGSIIPADAGTRAWVFSATDTAGAPVLQGNFMIENVKPGNYTLMVQGKPPYRNAIKQGIIVTEGQLTDVGIIQMQL